MRDLAFIVLIAGLVIGCGGGQTKPDDPNSHSQPRCGPQVRCGSSDDDRPRPKSGDVIIRE